MELKIHTWGDGYERSGCSITLTGPAGDEMAVSFSDGEPEDFVLARDLSDAKLIGDLIVAAHEAGLRGEDLIVTQVTTEDEDDD